jgi:hypothetical protein
MTVTPTRPRARWPWILGAIAAAIVVIAAVLGVTAALRQSAAPSPTATRTVTPTGTSTPDAAPTGCLGGSNRDNAMLLAAQKAAPHTTNGAVEVATAFVRWTFRHPTATVDEANQVAGDIIASDASDTFKDLGAAVSRNQNPSGGAVADGTDFYVSTTPGVYYVDSAAADKVTVSIGTGYVIGGAVNPQLRTSSTFTLEWERGAWRVQGGSLAHTTEELFKIGTPFTQGC